MNSKKLKSIRVERGRTQAELARSIHRSTDLYSKKEKGLVAFSTSEMKAVATELEMTFHDFNLIFFDGELPFGNF